MEKSLAAKLCIKAIEMSYSKSSKASCSGRVSKQTVKSLLHRVKEEPVKIQNQRLEVKEIHLQGLVSHTLSSRLSSRPCSWSYRGLDDVSRLRVHLLKQDSLYRFFQSITDGGYKY